MIPSGSRRHLHLQTLRMHSHTKSGIFSSLQDQIASFALAHLHSLRMTGCTGEEGQEDENTHGMLQSEGCLCRPSVEAAQWRRRSRCSW